MKTRTAAFAAIAALAFAGAAQASVSVLVQGSSNPFDAGHATPSDGGAGAVLATSALMDGQYLTFSVTGATSNTGGTPSGTADGGSDFGMGDRSSIAGATIPLNALVGVFLDANEPSGAAPADLSYGGDYSFAQSSPGLRQVFFIGDGLTGTGGGTVQKFFVPTGATRLFLGSTDGYGWGNNSGAFDVTVSGPGLAGGPLNGVPEPSSWALMIVGFGAAGAVLRRGAGRKALA